MAGPQLAQPAPLLVDQQQDRLDNSWTQPLIDQNPAWPRYVQGLIEAQFGDVDVAEHVMRNAQQVMHRSAVVPLLGVLTLQSILVDGEVQSGKTIMMIALTSYAIACGFKLVVVLAGGTKTLRKQNQKRFEDCFGPPDLQCQDFTTRPIAWLTRRVRGRVDRGDMYGTVCRLRLPQNQQQALAAGPAEDSEPDDEGPDFVNDDELEDQQGVGNNIVNAGGNLDVGDYQGLRNLLLNWSQLTPGQKPVLIAVIKKDTRSLKALKQLLQSVPGLKEEKHLIIDDEYDAATLTDPDVLKRLIDAAATSDSVPCAISRIRSQADGSVLPNSAYVGFTATSFAAMLLNEAKYEAMGLHVAPQVCWVYEQHPNTKGYVGLQQLHGGSQSHREVQTVPKSDCIQWEDYQEDAHTLSEAKGKAPAVGQQLIHGSSNMQKMTEVHLENTINRKATDGHGANLKKSPFKFLIDFWFVGGIRMFRWEQRPVLLTPQEHNTVMQQLTSQQPATHSSESLTGDAAALRRALQEEGLELQPVDLVELVLQLCHNGDRAQAAVDLLGQLTIELPRIEALLGTNNSIQQQVFDLLMELVSVANGNPPQPLQHLTADLMLGLSRPAGCNTMKSRFLWWALDSLCLESGVCFEVQFLSWARTRQTGVQNLDPAAPGTSASAAARGQSSSELRAACLSTRHLGRQAGRRPVKLIVVPAYTGFSLEVTSPCVLVPRGYAADAAVREQFTGICRSITPVRDAIEAEHVSLPVYHSGLINPSNKIRTHNLICTYMQQVWVILTTGAVMWLNGLRPADFQNDQQLEQAWQDQVDQLWTLQLRQRAGIEQSTFEAARARGATYLQKYLLPKEGRPKCFVKQFNRLRRSVEASAAETRAILPFPADPQQIKPHLLEVIQSTRFVVINSRSSNPAAELEPVSTRPCNIYIGGQVLSRGITIEGLALTWFLNASKTEVADVKIQAGRWFGHRSQYADLVRVYMTRRSQQAYGGFALAAKELRGILKECIGRGWSWQECRQALYRSGLLVRQTLQLTSSGRMRDALLMDPTKFLTPALNDQYSKQNYTATLQLFKQLDPYRVQPLPQPEGAPGAAIQSLGTLRRLGVVYHDVPQNMLQQYLSSLHDKDGDNCHGVLLATCLRESGSFVKDRVNVVVLQRTGGNSMAQTEKWFLNCSEGIHLVAGSGVGQQAAQQHAAQPAVQQQNQQHAPDAAQQQAAQQQAGQQVPVMAQQAAPQAAGPVHIAAALGRRHQQSDWIAIFRSHLERWIEIGAAELAAAGASGSSGPSAVHVTELHTFLRRHMLRVKRQSRPSSVSPTDQPFKGFKAPAKQSGFADQSLDAYGRMENQQPVLYGGHASRSWFTEPDKDGKRYRTCDAPPLVTICLADPVYAGEFRLAGGGNAAYDTFLSSVYDQQAAPAARAAAYPVPLVSLNLPRFGGLLHAAPGEVGFDAPPQQPAAAGVDPAAAAAAAADNQPAGDATSATTGAAASEAGSAAGSRHSDGSSSSSDDEAGQQQQQVMPPPLDQSGSDQPGSQQDADDASIDIGIEDSAADISMSTEGSSDGSATPSSSSAHWTDSRDSPYSADSCEYSELSDTSTTLEQEHSEDSMESYDSSSSSSSDESDSTDGTESDGSGSSWPSDDSEDISSDPEAAGPEPPRRQREQYSDDIPLHEIIGTTVAGDVLVSSSATSSARDNDSASDGGGHDSDDGGDDDDDTQGARGDQDGRTAGAATTASCSPSGQAGQPVVTAKHKRRRDQDARQDASESQLQKRQDQHAQDHAAGPASLETEVQELAAALTQSLDRQLEADQAAHEQDIMEYARQIIQSEWGSAGIVDLT